MTLNIVIPKAKKLNMNLYMSIFLILICRISVHAQFHPIAWDSTEIKIEDQTRHWDNGAIRLENKIEKGKLVRYQYYESGQLQLITQLKKTTAVDTISASSPEDLEQKITTVSVNVEHPAGKYKEFWRNGNIKEKGNLYLKQSRGSSFYTKRGKWIEFWENSERKRIAYYNKNGQLSGKFKEYYKNGRLKSSGKYKVLTTIEEQRCYDPNTYQEYNCDIEVDVETRVGKWKYFDESGNRVKN